ncbi:MAG: radical SAM protein [Methanopyri archaeon]|nr:radical SAM protein [Methanopyri archaeon]
MFHVTVEVTTECLHSCPHCNLRGASPDRMEPDELRDVLSLLVDRYDLDHVILTGGDPCLHPRFEDIVDVCFELDLDVGVNVATATHPVLGEARWVFVAFEPHREYGLDEAVRVWREVERYGPEEMSANTVVCRSTFDKLRDVNDLVVELGARAHYLIAYVPRGPEDPEDKYPHLEVPGLVKRLKRAVLAGMPFQEEVPFGQCVHGVYNLHVRVDGRFSPCQHWRDFTVSLEEFEAMADLEPEGPCEGCPRFGECQGGCNAYAWYVTGRIMPDPRCPRVREGSVPGF